MLNIELLKFWEGRDTAHYFQPSLSNTSDGKLLMTMQLFSGVSDKYGSPEFAVSEDDGKTWSAPQIIESLKTVKVAEDIEEGVADPRLVYHAKTGSVLAIAGNTFYGRNKCATQYDWFDVKKYTQHPVYAVYNRDGVWSEKKDLLPKSFLKDSVNWRITCAQVVVLPDGDIIVPIHFSSDADSNLFFSVCTARCSFDGEELKIKELGPVIHSKGVGLNFVEPQVTEIGGRFYLTIRAYDEKGYWAQSEDGLNWDEPMPWCWDDGSLLKMSCTQQHWLTLQEKLYLVYTREDESNKDIMRWRAPLFIAELDVEKRCLLRGTEQVALPLVYSDGAPGLMGNYDIFNASKTTSYVIDAPIWFKIVRGEKQEDDYLDDVHTAVWIAKVEV